MRDNWNSMMVDTADIQRADVNVAVSTIRDRLIAKYDTRYSSVRCFREDAAVSYEYNNQLGQVPVRNFTFYFNGGTDIAEGDRLKMGSTYYLVVEVTDLSRIGGGVQVRAIQKNFAVL